MGGSRASVVWKGLVLVALVALGVWWFWPDGGGGRAARARRCGTRPPSPERQEAIRTELEAFVRSQPERAFDVKLHIPVQFHVLHDGASGDVPEKRLRKQLDALNEAFEPHGIEFTWYGPPTRSDNAAWFEVDLDDDGYSKPIERAFKKALAVTPESVLNLYTAAPAEHLGWATFPMEVADDPVMDGVVVHHASLPRGGYYGYDLGRTAVHEVGHWLGLYHIFHPWPGTEDRKLSGCDDLGDEVDDTPPQRQPGECFEHPGKVRNSCNHDQPDLDDNLRNYMDYILDSAMDEFTPGQVLRMKQMTVRWRPALVAP